MIRLPPGPRSPTYVQLAHWVFRPIPFMRACLRRYGETFTVRFPYHPPLVFTAEPEAIRDVFRGDPDALHSGRANRILKPLVGRHSLLLLDGPRRDRFRDSIRRLMDFGGGGLEIFFVGRNGEPLFSGLQRRLGRLSPLGGWTG